MWSVRSVTQSTGVNALRYSSTDRREQRRASSATKRDSEQTRPHRRSPRDPHGRGRAPDGQRQEEVHDVDRDDRGAHRPADRDADAGRAAGGVEAVVAVDPAPR